MNQVSELFIISLCMRLYLSQIPSSLGCESLALSYCAHFLLVYFDLFIRANDVKTGTLIGIDKYGNKYYEDKLYFFGKS